MGCVPPQRKQSAAAASMSVKRQTSKEESKKNFSQSLDSNPLAPSNQTAPYFRVRLKKEGSDISSPKIKKNSQSYPQQTYFYQNQKKTQKQIIRVLSPKPHVTDAKSKQQQLSRLGSIHSLDLNSKIKMTDNKNTKTSKELKKIQPQENINITFNNHHNITFNNNNFTTHNSGARGLGMGKKWKEQTLRKELGFINQENFRKISVESMTFN